MFKRPLAMLAMLAGLVGRAASVVTGVDITPRVAHQDVPTWMGGYTGSVIPRGFHRAGGTHGSSRTRQFKSLKNKARRA